MRAYFRLSAVLTVTGALILGALGSGLWELLVKPLLFWVSTLFLNVATLGINSLRDGLYEEIARGNDPSGLVTFNLVISGFSIFVISILFFAPLAVWQITGEILRKRNLVRANAVISKLQLPSQRLRVLRRGLIGLGAVASLELGLFFIILTRETFVANGVIYLEQSQRAIAPHLTNDERIGLRSRAAQMQSKVDFDKLNAEILKVALENKVQLLKFTPF